MSVSFCAAPILNPAHAPLFAACTIDGQPIYAWLSATQLLIANQLLQPLFSYPLTEPRALAFAPHSGLLVVGCRAPPLLFFRCHRPSLTWHPLALLAPPPLPPTAQLALSASGSHLALAAAAAQPSLLLCALLVAPPPRRSRLASNTTSNNNNNNSAGADAAVVVQLRVLERVPLAAPCRLLAFSPLQKYLCVLGAADRLVKLRYCRESVRADAQGSAALLLSHPVAVTFASWRVPRRPLFESLERAYGHASVEPRAMLLTVARDGVVRLWLESPMTETLQFSVCYVLPARGAAPQYAVWVDCSVRVGAAERARALREQNRECAQRLALEEVHNSAARDENDDVDIDLDDDDDDDHDDDDNDANALKNDGGFTALRQHGHSLASGAVSAAVGDRGSGLESVRDPDWLLMTSAGGSVSLYEVEGANCHSRAPVDVTEWVRSSLAPPPASMAISAPPFAFRVRGVAKPFMQNAAFMRMPYAIGIVSHCSESGLRAHQVLLEEFGSQAAVTNVARHDGFRSGTSVAAIDRHNCLPLHVARDESGAVILWSARFDAARRVQLEDGANGTSSSRVAWHAQRPLLLLWNTQSSTVRVYRVADADQLLVKNELMRAAEPDDSNRGDTDDDDDGMGAFMGMPGVVAAAAPADAKQAEAQECVCVDLKLLGSDALFCVGFEADNNGSVLLWPLANTSLGKTPVIGVACPIFDGDDDERVTAMDVAGELVWFASSDGRVACARLNQAGADAAASLRVLSTSEEARDKARAQGAVETLSVAANQTALLTVAAKGVATGWSVRPRDGFARVERHLQTSFGAAAEQSNKGVSNFRQTVTSVALRASTASELQAEQVKDARKTVRLSSWLCSSRSGVTALCLTRELEHRRVLEVMQWVAAAETSKRQMIQRPRLLVVARHALSDAVTALEWADDSGALAVGTSQGGVSILCEPGKVLPGAEVTLRADEGSLIDRLACQRDSLPIYHPAQLCELLNAGETEMVGAVLTRVARELESDALERVQARPHIVERPQWHAELMTLERQASDASGVGDVAADNETDNNDDENNDDDDDDLSFAMMSMMQRKPAVAETKKLDFLNTLDTSYDQKAASDDENIDDDDDDDNDDNDDNDDDDVQLSDQENFGFGSERSAQLNERLSTVKVFGVSQFEQLQLISLSTAFVLAGAASRSADEFGRRFLYSALTHRQVWAVASSVRHSLAESARRQLPSGVIAWAVVSEATGVLLPACIKLESATWQECRALGVGLWLRKVTALRTLFEALAARRFAKTKSPGDCALFYVAMQRRSALAALYRAVGDKKLAAFFAHDFEESERWRTAAAKNAYVLLSKQRFELAAAMFALAGMLNDCVMILLDKLGDYQLAIVVARLLQPTGELARAIVADCVMPLARARHDVPLEAIAHWLLGERQEAAQCLYTRNAEHHVAKHARRSSQAAAARSQAAPVVSFSLMKSFRHQQEQKKTAEETNGDAAHDYRIRLPDSMLRASSGTEPFDPICLQLYNALSGHALVTRSADAAHESRLLRQLAAESYEACGHTLSALTQVQALASEERAAAIAPALSSPVVAGGGSSMNAMLAMLAEEEEEEEEGEGDETNGKDNESGESASAVRARLALRLIGAAAAALLESGALFDRAQADETASALAAQWQLAVKVQCGDTPDELMALVRESRLIACKAKVILMQAAASADSNPIGVELAAQCGLLERAQEALEAVMHKADGVNRPFVCVVDMFEALRLIIDRLHFAAASDEDESRLQAFQPVVSCVLATIRAVLFWFARKHSLSALHCVLLANPTEGEFAAFLSRFVQAAADRTLQEGAYFSDACRATLADQTFLASVCLTLHCVAANELFGGAKPALFVTAKKKKREVDDDDDDDDDDDSDDFDDENDADAYGDEAYFDADCSVYLRRALDVMLLQREALVQLECVAAMTTPSNKLPLTAVLLACARRQMDESWRVASLLDQVPDSVLDACEERAAVLMRRERSQRAQLPSAAAAAAQSSVPLLLAHVALEAIDECAKDRLSGAALQLVWRSTATLAPLPFRALFWTHACERIRRRMASCAERLSLDVDGPVYERSIVRLSAAAAARASSSGGSGSGGGGGSGSGNGGSGGGGGGGANSASGAAAGAASVDLFDARALRKALELRGWQRGVAAAGCADDAALVHDAKDLVLAVCVNACDVHYLAIATPAGVFDIFVHEENLHAHAIRGSRNGGAASLTPTRSTRSTQAAIGDGLAVNQQLQVPQHGVNDLRASSPSRARVYGDTLVLAQCLAAHPSEPYYASGGADGGVLVWQWNTPRALFSLRVGGTPRCTRVRFTPTGGRLAASDVEGNVTLWHFSGRDAALQPYAVLRCHSQITTDVAFLDGGRLFATAGVNSGADGDDIDDAAEDSAGDDDGAPNGTAATASDSEASSTSSGAMPPSKRDVRDGGVAAEGDSGCIRVWDVLRCGESARSAPPVLSIGGVHKSGATSLCVSHKHELLISGGRRGKLASWRLADGALQATADKGHSLNVKTLVLDRQESLLVSGATDGSVRTWSLPDLQPLQVFEGVHEKKTFVRATRGVFRNAVSTYGVMQVALTKDWLLSCGADGKVVLRKIKYA